jgi:hypothetical protein
MAEEKARMAEEKARMAEEKARMAEEKVRMLEKKLETRKRVEALWKEYREEEQSEKEKIRKKIGEIVNEAYEYGIPDIS